MVASAVVVGVAAPIVIPAALGAAGFTAAGVGAGTLAAGIQSGIGNVVAGSAFAGLIFLGARDLTEWVHNFMGLKGI